ncbi:uncharacterized protein LOC121779320 [Salvia splendens]|uniref:uncharacterized protein LOC121779320 n=1 Tax=Salvia splendens TaxID=180675 RepID=UPI001C2579AD|nr:uncharacterized protein LOC121779320 [Salvia splendens]
MIIIDANLNKGRVAHKMKIDRTRRSWSPREEEVLLSTMKGLVVTGWKADNGFCGGYLSRIMEALKREFPRTDLKTSPHITSKISQWKKSYNSLCGILGRSGVGFNLHNDYKIDCDDDQWEQIITADKEARNMRFKSWPMWDAWKEIFGKDRAVGTTAADLGEMSKEVCSTGVPFLKMETVSMLQVLVHLLVPIHKILRALLKAWIKLQVTMIMKLSQLRKRIRRLRLLIGLISFWRCLLKAMKTLTQGLIS